MTKPNPYRSHDPQIDRGMILVAIGVTCLAALIIGFIGGVLVMAL